MEQYDLANRSQLGITLELTFSDQSKGKSHRAAKTRVREQDASLQVHGVAKLIEERPEDYHVHESNQM